MTSPVVPSSPTLRPGQRHSRRFVACCLAPIALCVALAGSLGGRAIYARLTAPAPCGSVLVSRQQQVTEVPTGATACFLQAATQCAHKTLTVQTAGVDGSLEQELIVEPRHPGCVITDSTTGHGTFSIIPLNHDYTCTGVIPGTQALQLRGCQAGFPYDVGPIVPAATTSRSR